MILDGFQCTSFSAVSNVSVITIAHFACISEFMTSVGGQGYLFFYLNVEVCIVLK